MDSSNDWKIMNEDRRIIDYKKCIDHEAMMRYIDIFSGRYSFMGVTSIGRSLMGRSIPLISLGQGKEKIMYVGTHHGMEWITTGLLLRFVNEYCELYKGKSRIYNTTLEYLYNTKTVLVIPMLNPDGTDYQINGVGRDKVLYERLLHMNGDSEDFSSWQANGRGVDLNHNYNHGFAEYKRLESELGIFNGAPTKYSGTSPESEPEVGALCNYIRFNDDIRLVISLHTQGEEIYYSSGEKCTPRSLPLARSFSRMSGYTLSTPTGSAAYGGLLDWCINDMNIPTFTFECGKGRNPLPLSDLFKIYTDLREVLFSAPCMI